MMEERQLVESGKKIKDLFPDGKKTSYIFGIPSEVYNSVDNEKTKKERCFTKVKRLASNLFSSSK